MFRFLGIVSCILGGLSLPGILFVGFLFDAPGSTDNPYLVAAACGVILLPFALLVGGLPAAFAPRRLWARMLLLLGPIDFAFIVAMFVAINILYGGQFAPAR